MLMSIRKCSHSLLVRRHASRLWAIVLVPTLQDGYMGRIDYFGPSRQSNADWGCCQWELLTSINGPISWATIASSPSIISSSASSSASPTVATPLLWVYAISNLRLKFALFIPLRDGQKSAQSWRMVSVSKLQVGKSSFEPLEGSA